MVELNSTEMRNWLCDLGLTETHIDYLIQTSERDKSVYEKSLNLEKPIPVTYNFNGVDYIMNFQSVVKKKTLEDWFIGFHAKNETIILAYEEYENVKKDVSEKMALIDVSRLINPFLNEDELRNEIWFYIRSIIEGEMPVFLYPWHNKTFIFANECKPDARIDNRLHYADLTQDCQEYAVIHVSDYIESSLKYPKKIPFGNTVEVWKSYLPLKAEYVPTVVISSDNPPTTQPQKPATRLQLQVLALQRIRATLPTKSTKGEIFEKCKEQEKTLFGVISRARFNQIWIEAQKGY